MVISLYCYKVLLRLWDLFFFLPFCLGDFHNSVFQIPYTVQFSHSVVFNCFQPHGQQHARPPCPSPTSGVYPNSFPLSRRYHLNHLIFSSSLLLLPPIFPSIRVFSSESVLCIRWPKYWSFSFSISFSNEYSGLISLGWIGWIS